MPSDGYTLGVQLAFCLIARIGELRALTWDDYDEEHGILHFWHEIVLEEKNGKIQSDSDVSWTKSKKKKGERFVQVSGYAKEILKKLREINGDKKYILQGKNNAKHSISRSCFNRHLAEYCKAAGVRYLSSHKIRFWGIGEMYANEVPESSIQYSAGHSHVEMTRHYNRNKKIPHIDKWDTIFGSEGLQG